MLKLIVSRDWHCPQRIFMHRAQLLVIVYFLNSTKVKKLKKVEIVLWNAGVNITTLKCRGEYCCWNAIVEILLWNAGVNIATLKCRVKIAAEISWWALYSEMWALILWNIEVGIVALKCRGGHCYPKMKSWALCLWNAELGIVTLKCRGGHCVSEMQRWEFLL